jgi:hypothetical protein
MPLANINYLRPGDPNYPDNTLPGIEGPVDPGYGIPGGPGIMPPIAIPPLPGIWPPAGVVTPPIHYPPATASPPIFIPDAPPEVGGGPSTPPPVVGGGPATPPGLHPGGGPLPPAGVYPPLPPSSGIAGKVAILVWVIGIGYRWFVVDAPKPPDWPVGKPPESGPKR